MTWIYGAMCFTAGLIVMATVIIIGCAIGRDKGGGMNIINDGMFHDGCPDENGYYLVRLMKGTIMPDDSGYDIDYCTPISNSDGGGRGWVKYYKYNVIGWLKLPEEER